MLEDNLALLETKQCKTNKYVERLQGLWTSIEEKDTIDMSLQAFLTSCQRSLNKLVEELVTVLKYVPKDLDDQFNSCSNKCQYWLDNMIAVAAAAAALSEKDFSIASSSSHQA